MRELNRKSFKKPAPNGKPGHYGGYNLVLALVATLYYSEDLWKWPKGKECPHEGLLKTKEQMETARGWVAPAGSLVFINAKANREVISVDGAK